MPVGVRRRTALRIGLALVGALVFVLLLAQVLLPPIAAKVMRDRVGRYGTVKSASISAWPAIELLWGKADSARVSAGTLTGTPSQLLSQLWEARGVDEATLSAEHAIVSVSGFPHSLTLDDLHTFKQGSAVHTSVTLTQQALEEALPSGLSIQPLGGGGAGQVELRASGTLFGVQASILALVRPLDGSVVAEPQGLPFASLASVTLFSDPHLKVRSLAVAPVPGQVHAYRLSLGASLG